MRIKGIRLALAIAAAALLGGCVYAPYPAYPGYAYGYGGPTVVVGGGGYGYGHYHGGWWR